MRKIIGLFVIICIVLISCVSYADVIEAGNIRIEYESLDQLQEIYAAVQKQMGSQYKTILFDAATYESATFIVGENFPAGRYYIYPVSDSDSSLAKLVEIRWWSKEDANNEKCTDYIIASWCSTFELSDGMKFRIHWDDNELNTYVAMHKLPDDEFNLMDAFN